MSVKRLIIGVIKQYWVGLVFILIIALFFNKVFLKGFVPFPGDLLMANYEPYKSGTNLGITPGSVVQKGQGADVLRELYPWKHFSIESLKQGVFPLWNPYTFSGNSHFANLQSGTLYPVNILFFVMPFIPAWSIYIILQFVFMLLFTYLYLREIKLEKLASIVGAVAFSFSGFIIVWAWYGNLGHALSFLPLVLYCIEKNCAKSRWYWYLLLIISIALSILAGYIQLTMYLFLVAGSYVLARFLTEKKKNIKTFTLLVGSILAGILISSIQLLPIFEVVSLSLRSTYSYDVLLQRLMPPESIITLLVPDFFGNPATFNYFLRGGSSLERASNIGLIPLIFAALAIFSKKTFVRNFFVISAIIIYLSTFSISPVAYFHSIGIPFLSTGIPTRALSVFCFCLSVLSAVGVDSYLKNKVERKKILLVLGFFFTVFVGLWLTVLLINNPQFLISRRNLIIPSSILISGSFLIVLKIKRKFIVSALLVITIFDLFYSFQKFNSFTPSSYVFPETFITQKLRSIQGIDRYWGYGSANIEANYQVIDKNYSTEGYDPLFSKRYGEFISSSKDGNIPKEVPRSVANILPGYGVNELKANPNRRRALDLTGVKYILNTTSTKGVDSAFDEKDYQLFWEKNGWQIYKNLGVLPRVVLFSKYKIITGKDNIIHTLYDPSFDYQNTVILEDSLPAGFTINQGSNGTFKVISYKPNEVTIQTNSTGNRLLFLSDNYFPGWKATVDGVETPIYKANYTYRAVPVKSGSHIVKMTYSPNSFKYGLYISICSAIGLIAIFLFSIFSKQKRK